MEQNPTKDNHGALELTVSIVKAYVAHNSLPMGSLQDLIVSVDASLRALRQASAEPEKQALEPPVPIKRSVTPGYIISLEDGRQYKSLKRHLSGRGLTPDQYREKWNLPRDYPMVAPEYAAKRSKLAKILGLGRKSGDATNDAKPKAMRGGRKPQVS